MVPTADIEFEQKLRQALIIVDNEFRTGKGKGMFIRNFADDLPKPFIEMIFVLAIENQNTLMLEAIKKNNFDLFTTLDEQLKDSNPEFRQKAISQGTLYASSLLEAIFCKINSQHQDNGFEEAADLFSTLSADQKRDYFLYLMLHDCFEVSQNNCSNIDTYINNKKIFIEKALGLHRGMPDGNTIIGSMPADLLASSAL